MESGTNILHHADSYFGYRNGSLCFEWVQYGIPPEEELADLNNFLASRRVLSVRHELVENNHTPYMMFVVQL